MGMIEKYQILFAGLMAFGGVIFGFLMNIYMDLRTRSIESKNLAFAFKGELSAISAQVRTRRYIEYFEAKIAEIKTSKKTAFMDIRVRKEYFHVFINNTHKIGTLKNPLPEKLSAYYIQGNSILEDWGAYSEGKWKDVSWEVCLDLNKRTKRLMEIHLDLADEIVMTIDKIYPKNPDFYNVTSPRIEYTLEIPDVAAVSFILGLFVAWHIWS